MGDLTMKGVAEALGVSVTSVSNAFNKPDRISADLRQRILSGAAQLGYTGPDAAGRVLRSGKANAIGVIFNHKLSYAFTDPYAVGLLAAISAVLEERSITIALLPVPTDPDEANAIVNSAVVDGVIGLCATPRHPGVLAAARRGLPIVLTDDAGGELASVRIDDRQASLMLGEHVAGLGHRKVGLIFDDDAEHNDATLTRDWSSLADYLRGLTWQDALDRVIGLIDGLGDAQITYATAGPGERRNGKRCAAALLDDEPDLTAIVAVSDILALGVLDELADRGLVAGRDVSVAGFDGIDDALRAGLTTIRQPIEEKGRLAATLLLDPDLQPRTRVLQIELVIGTTTGPA